MTDAERDAYIMALLEMAVCSGAVADESLDRGADKAYRARDGLIFYQEPGGRIYTTKENTEAVN